MLFEKGMKDLSSTWPDLKDDENPYALGVIWGNAVMRPGQEQGDKGEHQHIGVFGAPVIHTDEAKEAAWICIMNLLEALKELMGDLQHVERIEKINGYIASTNDSTEHSKVIQAASILLKDIFGGEKKDARVAVGLSSLPGGATVEIEILGELKD